MTPRGRGVAAGLGLALAAGFACRTATQPADVAFARAEPPARPQACLEVAAGSALQPLVDAAPAGSALCLAPGAYAGPLVLRGGVTLYGPRDAVLRSSGEGTTLRVRGDGAALLGVTVEGSGRRFDLLDAAVHVQARDARVEGVLVRGALFGILVEQSSRVTIRGNEVVGDAPRALGQRGDSIRLWETTDSRVESNTVRDGRDLVVWYSSRNRIARNSFEGGRYGTHLMYSHDVEIEDNRYVGNVTGVFAMYSRRVAIRGNLVARSAGAAGIGVGLKESGDVTVSDNRFADNTVGIHVDTSPFWPEDRNSFERNSIRLSDTAVVFLSSPVHSAFRDNDFRDNRTQVRVDGRGDATALEWRGNDFDDYAGYDLDGDGVGDIPYQLRDVASELAGHHPAVALFTGSAALALLEAVGRAVPIAAPRLLLVDPAPRVGARDAG